jgi:hypothetical protein
MMVQTNPKIKRPCFEDTKLPGKKAVDIGIAISAICPACSCIERLANEHELAGDERIIRIPNKIRA